MQSRVLPKELVESVFSRLVALYGASFTRQWGMVDGDTMLRTWARELAGFSHAEISRGLEACKLREFPPTVPEFVKLCRPSLEPAVAFAEAARLWPGRSGYSNPAVYWAAMALGDDIRKFPYNHLRGRWLEAYSRAQDNAQPMPAPDPVPQLTVVVATPEEREAAYLRARDLWHRLQAGEKIDDRRAP